MKKAIVAAALMVLVGGLCGCSNSSSNEDVPKGEAIEQREAVEQEVVPEIALHPVQMEIKCNPNLFFSRYDVNILVDGVIVGVLDHGATETYQIDLKEGRHTLSVEKEDDSKVDGSVSFDVSQESFASCNLSLTSDQVAIEDFRIISKAEKEEQDRIAQEKAEAEARAARDKEEAEARAAREEAARHAQEEEEKRVAEERANAVLTAETDADFAEFISSDDYEVISSFASSHIGRIIEFDGNVAYVDRHDNYKTRFDYLIYTGDYSETSVYGPIFRFENVAYHDLHMAEGSPDSIDMGLNLHIKAKIVKYNSSTGITELDPVEISVR